MKISKNKVAAIHYTLTDVDGKVMDTSDGRDPLHYLHGHHNLIKGLESELENKTVGDKFKAVIQPEDAYGLYDENRVQTVAREMFQGVDDIQPGMKFQANTDKGQEIITVTAVQGNFVTIDSNHELAGETLTFDVEVMEVRDASNEEIEHGHVHGPGGHHH
jgi:FKBP-type peptidyl-prolyl cis-trans isomerase SlyD